MHETIGQKVPAMPEIELEAKANRFRTLLCSAGPIRAVEIIEFVLPRIHDKFHWESIDDNLMGNDLARTWPDQMLMHIADSVYDGAYVGNGACNHVLAHELGHLVLHRNVDPSFALAKSTPKYDCIFNSEWQADTFADYFLMPVMDVKATCVSILDIQNRYCVSKEVAERHYYKVFGNESKISEQVISKGQRQLTFTFQTKD